MRLSISEAAALSGLSVRALHYYDEIGLLKPAETTGAGYRYYCDAEMSTLQQIVFYRELGLTLKEISAILSDPLYDKTKALSEHRELLLLKRAQLDDMLRLVDETLGGKEMSTPKTTLADIQAAKEKYAREVKERWGGTKEFDESEEISKKMTDTQKLEQANDADDIFAAFAAIRTSDPAAPDAKALVIRWQEHINRYYYACSKEMLSSLGQMYTADERFTETIDRFGSGTAEFMSAAIAAYCAS